MTSNPSNDAVVAARWTSGTGMEIRYLPDFAYGYVQNTYQATSGQPYGDIYFRQNVGGTMTTRMAIKADGGNVGIGTATPNDKFHVVGGIYSTSLTTPINTNIGAVQIGYDGTNGVIRTWNSSPLIISTYNYQAFETTGSERLRITGTGNIGIGTTSPGARLDIAGGDLYVRTGGILYANTFSPYSGNMTIALGGSGNNLIVSGGNVGIGTTTDAGYTLNVAGNAQFIKSSTSTAMVVGLSGVTGSIIRFSYNGGFVGSISTDGSNTAYNTSSDYRLKEQVRAIDNPLEKVLKLNPVNFKYKNSKTVQDGFIAHEIQEILPYLVTGEKDGEQMQEVDYSKITPILIAAIKEQQAQIQELKNKLS
jgi:hypothetical protein